MFEFATSSHINDTYTIVVIICHQPGSWMVSFISHFSFRRLSFQEIGFSTFSFLASLKFRLCPLLLSSTKSLPGTLLSICNHSAWRYFVIIKTIAKCSTEKECLDLIILTIQKQLSVFDLFLVHSYLFFCKTK